MKESVSDGERILCYEYWEVGRTPLCMKRITTNSIDDAKILRVRYCLSKNMFPSREAKDTLDLTILVQNYQAYLLNTKLKLWYKNNRAKYN